MLANTGEQIPPWGVPSSLGTSVLSIMMPLLRKRRISVRTLVSAIRRAISSTKQRVRDFIEAGPHVSLNHPSVPCFRTAQLVEWLNTVHRATSRPKTVREVVKVCFPDRFQYHFEQHLNRSILHGGNSERPRLVRPWFWDLDPSHWHGFKGTGFEFRLYFVDEVLSELLVFKITFLRIVEVLPTHSVYSWRMPAIVAQNMSEGFFYPLSSAQQVIQVTKLMRLVCLCFTS